MALVKWNALNNTYFVLTLMLILLPCIVDLSPDSDITSHNINVKNEETTGLLYDELDVTLDDLSNTTGNNTGISSSALGFIAAAVAVLLFGSNLVPIKKADTGDGMYYQWVECIAIWHVGLIVHLIRGSPPFYPLAMLGGFLWATGNITVVPIIKTLGLSLGILIWGSLNLLTGWASGHFGLFGIKKDQLHNVAFNYVGVSLALLSAILYLLVKSDVSKAERPNDLGGLIDNSDSSNAVYTPVDTSADASWVDKLSPLQKRIVGILMAIPAGCLYGFNFVPCIWIQDNVKGASQHGLDYVFAHFCGISLTSSVYFMVYCMYMRNRPQIGVGLIIPSVVSGLMWGIAQSGWFIANFSLSESVSFPIITTGPGIIASLWGVLLFREIQGIRNLGVLVVAFAITIMGAVFTALSK